MNNFKFVLMLALMISVFQSCVKEPIEPIVEEVAPELPPQQSFVMPFDGFEDADTSGFHRVNSDSRTITSFRNWFYSATNVVVWNTAISLQLWLPIASFQESFRHQATFLGDKTWLWTYEFTGQDGKVYTANLKGKVLDSEEVEWEMKMSKAGGFTDVVWYTGLTAKDNSYASWTLNHQANNPEALIGIDYTRDEVNKVESIRYTNIRPNNPDNGDYIEFQNLEDGSDYNKSYDVYQIKRDNLLEIRWNDPSNDGRVKDPKHFNDEEWHCWDTDLKNVDC